MKIRVTAESLTPRQLVCFAGLGSQKMPKTKVTNVPYQRAQGKGSRAKPGLTESQGQKA